MDDLGLSFWRFAEATPIISLRLEDVEHVISYVPAQAQVTLNRPPPQFFSLPLSLILNSQYVYLI